MPYAKVTYFMEDPEGYGSSESFWISYTDSLQNVLPQAQTLFKTRLGLCGNGMTGTYLRISDDAISGDALVDTTTYYVGQAAGDAPAVGGNQKNPSILKPALPESTPALPNLVLSVRFQLGTAARAIKYLHGLPVQVLTTPPGPAFIGDFIAAWKAWNNLFPANGGQWLIKSRATTGGNVKTPVQMIQGPVGGPYVITAQGHQITNGQTFVLGGFKGKPGIRGTYIAANVVAGVSLQAAGSVPIANITIPNKGYVQALAYTYAQITGMQADEQCFRKAGRPFGLRPGRRKARAS